VNFSDAVAYLVHEATQGNRCFAVAEGLLGCMGLSLLNTNGSTGMGNYRLTFAIHQQPTERFPKGRILDRGEDYPLSTNVILRSTFTPLDRDIPINPKEAGS
jgi:hypothetical protein